ncbi:MAG: hypothetical protein KAR40_12970 [Candidatus Sabulitectum sp.]|nr:hypothetical protein [Candidatus Sabulitectum sp.]
MSRTKYIILLSCTIAAVMLALLYKPDIQKETSLRVINGLPDITLSEIYLASDTINHLEHQLRPGEAIQITIPRGSSTIEAIDLDGGIYNSGLTITDSTETLQIELSMANRAVFEETVESGGEYWAGSGTGTIRITNALREKDVYWLNVAAEEENPESSPDRLGAFILWPGRTLNVRVNPGFYLLTAEDNLRNKYTCATTAITHNRLNYGWEITRDYIMTPLEESGTGSSRLVLCNALDDWIITGVYHRNSTDTNWSRNHLIASGIEPKEQYSLLLDPGTYDIRVVDEDNDTYTRLGVTISEEVSGWDITMNDLDRFIP